DTRRTQETAETLRCRRLRESRFVSLLRHPKYVALLLQIPTTTPARRCAIVLTQGNRELSRSTSRKSRGRRDVTPDKRLCDRYPPGRKVAMSLICQWALVLRT